MIKYHVNEKGVPGPCSAKIKCQFGGDAQHYFSPEAAREAFELSMAKETIPVVKKKETADVKPFVPSDRSFGPVAVERYKHPQGKIVEINSDGTVTAWKNGKVIPTSATADKLRRGHGSWKPVALDDGGERPYQGPGIPVRPSARILKQDAANNKPALSSDQQDRITRLVNSGYPASSGLDPRNEPKVENRQPARDPEPTGWRNGRALLPTGDRVNPHDKPEGNSYIQGWASSGDESVIAIVKQSGPTRDIYRSLLSGHKGESSDIIGDSFKMEHDQTGAAIGHGYWTVVGVYEPKAGGAVSGEVPNQKIPFYVYK